ncbi:diaminopimelate decarboxylase [Dokdonella fugitiva]|uniref:Diaminopimelate decarboxylase n=1 Tax=Dokdonella fugitiva TaxID=328517 RepID=A0A4R2HYC2_9GAMM|nr:diaminopimelate decarboxylase [Dokdonella fugitiva]TCO36554.1 diaminopimelate decarboxylase [Dokdonella fugitiva]
MAAVPEADDCGERTCVDGVDLEALARRLGTPLHVYSASRLRRRAAELRAALAGLDALVCYAVKANPNVAVLALMADEGFGADIVSAGELRRSLCAGIASSRIVFSGVGKTADEIAEALAAGIGRFNVESRDELDLLQRVARDRGQVAHASVRVNPDVDAGTHAKIATGKAENKFGVEPNEAWQWFAEHAHRPNVVLDGLHVHIGSQVLELAPFARAFERIAVLARDLLAAGHAIACIDAGGGLGVRYRESHDVPVDVGDYARTLRHALRGFGGRLIVEPGRWLVAEAGVLLTRVIRVKHGARRRFLVLDAAMNDLQRPSLYDAWHAIEPLHGRERERVVYDVVGPVCETGDTFARARELPRCEEGDLVMIETTGAYGASMASTYNSRPLAAEAMVERGRYAVVRRRQHFDEMLAGEQPAGDWQVA